MKLSHFALAGLFLLFGVGIYLTMKTEMDGQVEQLKADNERKFQQWERSQKEQTALLQKATEAIKDKADPNAPAAATAATAKIDKQMQHPAVAEDPVVPVVKKTVKSAPAIPPAPGEVADAPPSELLPPPPGTQESPELAETRIRKEENNLLNSVGVNDERRVIDDGKITGAISDEKKLTRTQSIVVAAAPIARVKETNKESFVVLDRGSNSGLASGDRFEVRRGTFVIGKVAIGETVYPTECVADVTSLITGAALQKGDEIIKLNNLKVE